MMETVTLAAGSLLDGPQIAKLFLALAVLLLVARVLGELARSFNQPAVLGEILAGILLGPTFFQRLAPGWHHTIFPADDAIKAVLEGFTTIAIALYLLTAGMEVDLRRILRQGKTASLVSAAGLVAPFAMGFAAAYGLSYLGEHTSFLPDNLMGRGPNATHLVFALFLATAVAISALPVIARTLMDLGLYRSDLGMVIIAAAIINDLLGWMVFAVVLGMVQTAGQQSMGLGYTVGLTVAYVVGVLTVVRWLVHRCLPWMQAHLSWPGGVIGISLGLALLGAACTQMIGIHAVFGAFIVGVALGDSVHFHPQTRDTINQFASFFFAPLFFASIGLQVDFIADFDPFLVLLVLAIPVLGKVFGCHWAARFCRMDSREAWAIGWGMTASGAMGIIVGLLALRLGLIEERLFVAIVIMALLTSLASGPIIKHLLRRKRTNRFSAYLSGKAFVPQLLVQDREGIIRQLAHNLSVATGLEAAAIGGSVMQREQMMDTGLPNGIAVPHARMAGLQAPIIAVGLSGKGANFEAADGKLSHVIFMILTPEHDSGAQLQILADLARTFSDPTAYTRLLPARTHTELLAAIRSISPPDHDEA